MAEEGQEHPISTYLWVWLLLFVLSAFSYAVDYVGFQGFTRWSLVLLFMFLKAYFICAVFMHMVWERMALVLALFIPTFSILVFIGIMGFESDYTQLSRKVFFDTGKPAKVYEVPHSKDHSKDHSDEGDH
ncbi:MAG: cytochrome C oxidase subunit IV [Rhodobiaceae bacterium]|nr:cytochrome C oxidase subunit IV [Rhodobiaceae bacterium]|tara:strand:+ start:1439 stop:1828 length:390 start_codon:yes stop_codon:yes gene_type:complete